MAFTSLNTFANNFKNKKNIIINTNILSAPSGLSTSTGGIGARYCRFTFNNVTGATSYIITAVSTSAGTSVSFSGSTSPIVVYNLYPETTYTAYIKASNSNGQSANSTNVSFTTIQYSIVTIDFEQFNYLALSNNSFNYNLYLTSSNNSVYKSTTSGTTVGIPVPYIGLDSNGGYNGNNVLATGTDVILQFPKQITTLNNNIYFVDYYYGLIRMVPSQNMTGYGMSMTANYIYTIAGNYNLPTYVEGAKATTVGLTLPYGVAINPINQHIYIADTGKNMIRKINFNTGIITTIAGSTNVSGYSGDGGQAISAKFNQPLGLTLDSSNNLYIADRLNQRVRKITAVNNDISGNCIITTYASVGYTTTAKMDIYNNLYVTDMNSSFIQIVKYSTGTGTATPFLTGFDTAEDIVIDNSGNIFICDRNSVRIAKNFSAPISNQNNNLITTTDSNNNSGNYFLPSNNNAYATSMSTDGQYIAFITGQNQSDCNLYISSNYGATWYTTIQSDYYLCVTMNTIGQYIAVAGTITGIFVSNDYGTTWTQGLDSTDATFTDAFTSIKTNSDGSIMVATATDGYTSNVYISSNYGVNWSIITDTNVVNTPSSTIAIYYNCIINDTGTNIIVFQQGGYFAYSTDSGTTWATNNPNTFVADDNRIIVSDITGQFIVIAVWTSNIIFTSIDYGNSWYMISNYYNNANFSNSAQCICGATNNNGFFILFYDIETRVSFDYGLSWNKYVINTTAYTGTNTPIVANSASMSNNNKLIVTNNQTINGNITPGIFLF